jgi:hypothetical protein
MANRLVGHTSWGQARPAMQPASELSREARRRACIILRRRVGSTFGNLRARQTKLARHVGEPTAPPRANTHVRTSHSRREPPYKRAHMHAGQQTEDMCDPPTRGRRRPLHPHVVKASLQVCHRTRDSHTRCTRVRERIEGTPSQRSCLSNQTPISASHVDAGGHTLRTHRLKEGGCSSLFTQVDKSSVAFLILLTLAAQATPFSQAVTAPHLW